MHPEFDPFAQFWPGRDFTETFTLTIQPVPNSPNIQVRLVVPDRQVDTASNPYRSSRSRPTAGISERRAVTSLPARNAARKQRVMVLNDLFFIRTLHFRSPLTLENEDCLVKFMSYHLYSLEGRVDCLITFTRVGGGYQMHREDRASGESDDMEVPPMDTAGGRQEFVLPITDYLGRGPSFTQAMYNAPCDQQLMLEVETENGDCGELEFTYWQGESLPVEAVRQNPAAGIQSGPGLTRPELASDPLEPRQKPQVK